MYCVKACKGYKTSVALPTPLATAKEEPSWLETLPPYKLFSFLV